MKKKLVNSTRLNVILHLLAWAILILLPIYFVKRFQTGKDFIWFFYTNIAIYGLIFYINFFILVPRLFFRFRRYIYFISVAVLLVVCYLISDKSNRYIFSYFHNGKSLEIPPPELSDKTANETLHDPSRFPRVPIWDRHVVNYSSTAFFLIFFSLGLRILERHSKIEKAQKELEREKLNSELALLKNQISPHFFFNTLNNIYSLISINPADSQKAVIKLSKMMRYLLYETEHGNIKLSSEIEFMTNYIDLMKLRMSDKIALTVSFPSEYEDTEIPPLLFIPFIENAFKHGISFRENSFIDISMNCSKDTIIFRCVNSITKGSNGPETNTRGIGLGNVMKRLDLLFPGMHYLKISRTDNVYEVNLNLKI
jgi:two-component system, LytTR family, sensor kinase